MQLQKDNIQLRAVEPSDLDCLYKWENNVDVWKVSQTYSPFSKYTLKEYCSYTNTDIFSAKQLRFMIDFTLNNKTVTVGAADIFDYEPVHRKAGIGILVADTAQRRKGIAAAALELLAGYAFGILNLHQVHCIVSINNIAAIKLFEKLGFVNCGIIKHWLLISGKWEDVCFFQKIND